MRERKRTAGFQIGMFDRGFASLFCTTMPASGSAQQRTRNKGRKHFTFPLASWNSKLMSLIQLNWALPIKYRHRLGILFTTLSPPEKGLPHLSHSQLHHTTSAKVTATIRKYYIPH